MIQSPWQALRLVCRDARGFSCRRQLRFGLVDGRAHHGACGLRKSQLMLYHHRNTHDSSAGWPGHAHCRTASLSLLSPPSHATARHCRVALGSPQRCGSTSSRMRTHTACILSSSLGELVAAVAVVAGSHKHASKPTQIVAPLSKNRHRPFTRGAARRSEIPHRYQRAAFRVRPGPLRLRVPTCGVVHAY